MKCSCIKTETTRLLVVVGVYRYVDQDGNVIFGSDAISAIFGAENRILSVFLSCGDDLKVTV